MSARWQPLTTAEEVVEAMEKGSRVEWRFPKADFWILEHDKASVRQYKKEMRDGMEYRGLVEGGEGGAE